jgi:hypothetical protein
VGVGLDRRDQRWVQVWGVWERGWEKVFQV